MPFLLDGNPTQGEISEAINYLLSNFTQNVSADPNTGQIIGPTGEVQAYLYRYIQVKYADSFDGSVGFSNTPTNKGYFGLRNTDSSVESTNPVDYIWTQVTGGFGTTKLLYYTVTGGRQISIIAALAAPSALWQADSGSAIDLDVISGSDGSSSRICYAKSTSFALASTPATYQTTGPSGFPPFNTWGGSETWQATPPTLLTNEALFQSDGVYNPMTNLTTWNVPYLSNLKVGALSAITANLGTITAGSLDAVTITGSTLTIGSSPAISGSTMTGSGAKVYSDGRFALGNSSGNVVFNGSTAYLNGFAYNTTSVSSGLNLTSTPQTVMTFTVPKAVPSVYGVSGYLVFTGSGFLSIPEFADLYLDIVIYNSAGIPVYSFSNYQVYASIKVFQSTASGSPYYAVALPYGYSYAFVFSPDTYTMRMYYGATPTFWTTAGTPTTPTTQAYWTAFRSYHYQATV